MREADLSIKNCFNLFFHDKDYRTSKITMFTMYYNYIWAGIKIIFGIFFSTFYFCLSGIYTILIASTKRVFHNNYNQVDKNTSLKKFLKMAILILVASVIFILYMCRLFFIEYSYSYNKIIGIAVAAFSFTELGISIGGLIRATKKNNFLMMAIKCCNLSSAFIAIVLTQISLLSIKPELNVNFYNALSGVIFGMLSALIGIFMIFYYKKQLKLIEQ